MNGGQVLGEDRFKDEIEAVMARRVRPGRGGWPGKKDSRRQLQKSRAKVRKERINSIESTNDFETELRPQFSSSY